MTGRAGASDPERAADAVLGRFLRDDGPGLAVGASRGGAVLLRKGYGLADVGAGMPNGADVPMRIASLSKQFLVFAALLLEAEGRLSADDDVREHLPVLPDYGARVTLLDLMSNQSGIRDFLEMRLLSGGGFAGPASDEENLALAAASGELNFPPRSRFAYSNTGFMLLTKVVEAIEGEPLEAVLQRRVFGPLGMTRTSLRRRDEPWLAGRAVPYVESGTTERRVGRWGVPLDGAGGVVSTVDDLLVWAAHMLDAAHPHAPIVRRMAEARAYANGTPSLYGLGLTVMPHRGLASFGHHGQLAGLFAEIALFPAIDAAIVLLANTDDLNPFETGRRLADALFPDAFGPSPPAGRLTPGLYADFSRDLVLEVADASNGTQTLSSVMTTASVEWHRPGRFRPLWPMLHLDLAVEGEDLVGFDGPDPVRLRKLSPVAASAGTARGAFVQADLRSVWALRDGPEGPALKLSGALGEADYALRPRAPGLFQARPAADPVGPYRPIVRLTEGGGTRRLVVTTDRTAHLSARSADTSSHPSSPIRETAA